MNKKTYDSINAVSKVACGCQVVLGCLMAGATAIIGLIVLGLAIALFSML